jgi:starch phosphorylase
MVPRYVRMANLAVVGSFAVNGVAKLHSDLLKSDVLKDFHEMWPEKFSNKTNGVTPRRFVVLANPTMSGLIEETIGTGWVTDMMRLRELEPYADDPAFRETWRRIKGGNKNTWSARSNALPVSMSIRQRCSISRSSASMSTSGST